MHQRRRNQGENKPPSLLHEFDDAPKKVHQSHVSLLLVFAWMAALILFTFYRHTWLPEPKGNDIPLSEFSEARTRVFLEELQSIDGFRTVGSTSNEVETPKWLLGHLNTMKDRCVAPCQFEIEVQRPTGAFGFNYGSSTFQSVYANVTNILVRVQRTTHTSETPCLLVSSHYDAAVGSPAASDDGVNIAIMLELLQNAIAKDLPQQNGLIFNFNGAEETYLQAAHGFITQHPWKDQVAAFMNLEATGAGGRELLFQADSDVLAMAYAQGAPYPHASILGQELFQAKLVPGATDFQVYADGAPGMDFAYVANGYVYHTGLDDMSRIQPGAIQRFGDNLAGTMVELFPVLRPGLPRGSSLVFFDVLGYRMFITSSVVARTVALAGVGLAVIYSAFFSPISATEILIAGRILVISTGAGLTAAVAVAAAFLVLAPLSWFASPVTGLWVFVLPSIVGFLRFFPSTANPDALSEVLILSWLTVTLLLLAFNIQSAYLPFAWVAFPLLGHLFVRKSSSSWLRSSVLMLTTSLPLAHSLQLFIIVLQLFIPLAGRRGTTFPMDVLIAVLTSTLTLLFLANAAPLLAQVPPQHLRVCRSVLPVAFAAVVLLALISSPYSTDCPKRLWLFHLHRNFSSLGLPDDAGLWVQPMDFLAMAPLAPFFALLAQPLLPPPPSANVSILSNLPWYYPVYKHLRPQDCWYLPTAPPPSSVGPPTYVDVISTTFNATSNRREVHLFVTGPSKMTVIIDASATNLTSWSLGSGKDGVPAKAGDVYMLQMATGSPVSAFHVWVEAESNATLTLAYAGFHSDATTPALQSVLALLPPWTTESHVVASWGILRA
ncbi:Aste57867_18492 [Aphanomyces stellatus]|uniref:Aste57867_18492 protein n=1 Tax=Aphanomyces stellatus TaxID=120398 RepID=A0A485LBV4_9STRA|nr:hypothetical protein As57867_018430 [Aphanomyces stellatus]VFT95228.1 Aste57867_18492 [Aphanomyces stellatus]